MLITLRETSLLCLLLCSTSVVATVEGDAEKHDIAALAKEWATSGEPQLPLPSTSGGVSARIVNGNDAPQSRFGYAVSLQSYGFHFCGGSLIAPNIVLSAAHCAPKKLVGTYANINSYDLDSPGSNSERIRVTGFRTHPSNNLGTDLSNDFMLLKLSSLSDSPTVRLNTDSDDPQTSNPELTVMGWGTTREGVNSPPDVLQEVEVSYISNTACKRAYGSSAVSSEMMCCREAGQGACQGDSGGPLVIKGNNGEGSDVQVGLVSWGYDCALASYPGVYGRVSAEWAWIRENVCDMADGKAPDYFECDGRLGGDGGDGEQAEYVVRFKTDLYPEESSWEIKTLSGDNLYSGFPSRADAVQRTVVNLVVGDAYIFSVKDTVGDGLCCTFGVGDASIYYGTSTSDDGLQLVKVSGQFGYEDSVQFVAADLSDGIGGDSGGGGGGGQTTGAFAGCFPGTAKVQVEGQGAVLMKDVKLGDRVLVDGSSNNKYEPVYSFAHRVEEGQEEFQKLVTSKATLELTKGHLVFLEGGRSVPASMVTAGDKLELASGEFDIVKSVKTVVREGLYAPFTASGTIIVNGIKASTFIAFQESETIKIGSFDTGLTYHSVSHSFERPHRVWCEYFSGCTSEGRTAEGVSVWADIPHKIARWAFAQDSMLYSSVPLAFLLMLAYPLAIMVPIMLVLLGVSRRLSLRVKSVQ